MLLGAFVADALSLGVHWVYNTRVIDKKFGRVDGYLDPLTSYHTGKKAGDLTHYGDQMLVLLDSLQETSGFELSVFVQNWRRFFDTYTGYFDGATKDTLQNLSEEKDNHSCGSASDDLAGASRISPICYVSARDVEKLAQTVRVQTAFTHNNPLVIDAAEFFGRTTAKVLAGAGPLKAVETVLGENFMGTELESLVQDGLDSQTVDTRQAIADFGQMCSAEAAIPGTMHLIARYENDFERALIENVMAGGDSAARDMPAGMILGAHIGLDAIPERWLKGLTSYQQIIKILDVLDDASAGE